MESIISLDALYNFLHSLPLTDSNKIWLAEKLMEDVKDDQPPCRYTVEEMRQRIRESERRFARGEYVTEEEMEEYLKTLND